LTQAAEHLDVSPRTLRLAAEAGKIPVKHPLPQSPWIFNRSDLDSDVGQQIMMQAQRKRKGAAIPNPNQPSLFKTTT
jgi:hypothetical protein